MKVFDLICGSDHRFEGWFASAEQFAEQCDALVVRCPLCESSCIRREPSAPRLNLGGVASAGVSAPAQPAATPQAINAATIGLLRRLVEQTEDVGSRFAEEARRIHYDETPARPIRGTATDREKRDLRDEGIETLDIPIPRALTETMQ